MSDELSEYFRCEEQNGTWVFQVAVLSWDGPCTPVHDWKTLHRWKTQPDETRLAKARAKAVADPRFFRHCTLCSEVCKAGYMHSDDVCQGCAERHLGVVH